MNLLQEPWMPVRRRNGQRDWVSPTQLSDPDIVGWDAHRADFNGALAQFAIGLLQTTYHVTSPIAWRKLFKSPPEAATLASWFAPHAAAFEFDGDGARFMQDHDLRPDDETPLSINGLFIESPGENTIKNNADHFVKRHGIQRLCPHCAALALFTLQTNAPSGGAGHRTGLRGGGPLTTLLIADDVQQSRSLWESLWLNVQPTPAAQDGHALDDLFYRYPWLVSQSKLQTADGAMTPVQLHPHHVYWAMPRRIRLDMEHVTAGACDICGRDSAGLIQHYVTRNYGLNYEGPWEHPLSPYYKNKNLWLPVHPQPGGLGYQHWLSWVMGTSSTAVEEVKVASAIRSYWAHDVEQRANIPMRLWVFGYDLKQAKARCWYESTLPLYDLPACDESAQKSLREDVATWLAGAELAAGYLRRAVKAAWFDQDAKGDYEFVDAAFWSTTESAFYRLLKARINSLTHDASTDAQAAGEPPHERYAREWQRELQRLTLDLFDHKLVGVALVNAHKPQRIATAYQSLAASLYGPKLAEALQLSKPVKDGSAPGKGKSKTKNRNAEPSAQ